MPDTRTERELNDRLWDRVRPLLPPPAPHPKGADAFLAGVADAVAVDEVLGSLFTLLAGQCGAYRHRRQWRVRRGADIVGTLRDMIDRVEKLSAALDRADAARPLMAPDFDGIPDDRATLQAAAKGDAAALDRARPYLTDRRYIARWGSPMYAARCWLVGQACGDDHVVARATHHRATQLADGLGFQEANALERLAITRVVRNWLMVGVLEVKACGWTPHTKEHAQVERSKPSPSSAGATPRTSPAGSRPPWPQCRRLRRPRSPRRPARGHRHPANQVAS